MTVDTVDLGGVVVDAGAPVVAGPRGPAGTVDVAQLADDVLEALEPPVDLTQLFLNAVV